MPSVYIPVAFGSITGTIPAIGAHLAIILDSIPPVGHKPLGEFLRLFPWVMYVWKGVYHAVEHQARLWTLEEVGVPGHGRRARTADSEETRQALSQVRGHRDGHRNRSGHHVGTPKTPTASSLTQRRAGSGVPLEPAAPAKPLGIDPSRNPPRGGSLLPPEIDPAALVIGDRTGDYGD